MSIFIFYMTLYKMKINVVFCLVQTILNNKTITMHSNIVLIKFFCFVFCIRKLFQCFLLKFVALDIVLLLCFDICTFNESLLKEQQNKTYIIKKNNNLQCLYILKINKHIQTYEMFVRMSLKIMLVIKSFFTFSLYLPPIILYFYKTFYLILI